jgi:hypothetical protein
VLAQASAEELVFQNASFGSDGQFAAPAWFLDNLDIKLLFTLILPRAKLFLARAPLVFV